MEPVTIKPKKTQSVILVMGGLAFVLLGIFMLTVSHKGQLVPSIVAVAGIVFFGGGGILALSKSLNPSTDIVISDEGINDNSSYISVGLIEWQDILKVDEGVIKNQSFIMIYVMDPDKYLSRASGIKHWFMKQNCKWYGSPLAISTKYITMPHKDLLNLLKQEIATRKASY
ncbi:MAG: hypothetical protein JST49_09970 [Bacteroidetes bacterium]|nr:hypothetical protein [Bacteroidota bacterium]